VPIDSYLPPEDRADFMQGALSALSFDGKLFGLPYDAYVQVMYYRKDLFQRAGLRVPTMADPYTWDEFVAAAKKLQTTEASGRVQIWGTISEGKRHPAVLARFIDLLYQAGGTLFDNRGQPAFNSQAGVDALTFQANLVYESKVAPPGTLAFDHTDNHTLFMQGQTAMARNHSYAFALINDRAVSTVTDLFGVAPPLKKARSTTSFGAWGWSVAASSKQRDLALRWVRFITSAGQLFTFQRTALTVPLRKSEVVLFEKDPTFTPVMREAIRVFGSALDNGVPRPRLPQWPRVQESLMDAMVASMARQKSPKQALDDAAVQVQKILSEK
jgi:multiple sugar transport system substrate-binding protein